MKLHWFKIMILQYIFKHAVTQSPHHADNITKIYDLLHSAAEQEFTEDSPLSLETFLRERFEKSNSNFWYNVIKECTFIVVVL